MSEPWFRMHANIGDKPVAWRLAACTKISLPKAVGHLALFWGKVSQHAPGGEVGSLLDSQIEAWAAWDGPPGDFANWLKADHLTNGVVNEYEEYSGVLDVTREKNRKRKQEQRDKERTSRGRHADVTLDVPPSVPPPVTVTSEATIRYDTIRYDTKEKPSRAVAPWMGLVRDIWHEVYPDGEPLKGTAKTLKPLFDKHPEDEVCEWLRQYLRTTDPRFINLAKAVTTYSGPEPRYINGADDSAVMKFLGMTQ
jgi:hypothetical protein